MQKQIYLSEHELVKKWGISHRTLQRWRWLNQEPNYLKIGGRVRYRPEDVEAFAKVLVKLCGKSASVIIYNQGFEMARNRVMAACSSANSSASNLVS